MVVRSTQRGGLAWRAAAAMMCSNATDIIGHAPPGTWPRQLTTASTPSRVLLTSSALVASPVLTCSAVCPLRSSSFDGVRTSTATSCPESSASFVNFLPVGPVAPRTAIFIARCAGSTEMRTEMITASPVVGVLYAF